MNGIYKKRETEKSGTVTVFFKKRKKNSHYRKSLK